MYEVVGIEHREYDNKAGKHVTGYNLYVTYNKVGVEGIACMSEWVRPEIVDASPFAVGDKVNIFYNRYGRVEAISVVE